MKKRRLIAIILATMIVATGCGAQNSNSDGNSGVAGALQDTTGLQEDGGQGSLSNGENENNYSAEASDAERTPYDDFLDASIMTTVNQNFYRLKGVLEKAKAGEVVNVAALGGSITEGAGATSNDYGYAYKFAESFEEKYCPDGNLNFVNAGLGGTPSSLGVMRYTRDVVEALGTDPDLLIIEFAVNDYMECTNGRAYESLIYQALTANEDAAVILLFSSSSGKQNLQANMALTGNYYGLPMVSILNALTSTDLISDDEFFHDEYHPSSYGHMVMSDCLMRLLEVAEESEDEEPFEIPSKAHKGRNFTDMILVYDDTEGIIFDRGSFTETDDAVQSCHFFKRSSFPDNYMKEEGSENESLVLTLTCTKLLFNYKTSKSDTFGSAEIYVDGEKVRTVDGYASDGWNSSNVILIIDEKEAAEHTVEIKMAEGSENKKFTILAFAYN